MSERKSYLINNSINLEILNIERTEILIKNPDNLAQITKFNLFTIYRKSYYYQVLFLILFSIFWFSFCNFYQKEIFMIYVDIEEYFHTQPNVCSEHPDNCIDLIYDEKELLEMYLYVITNHTDLLATKSHLNISWNQTNA